MIKQGLKAFSNKEYQKALDIADSSIESDPENSTAYLLQGRVHQELNNFKQAIQSYEEAAKRDPLKPMAWKGLVQCAAKAKSADVLLRAIEHLILAFEQSNERDVATNEFLKCSTILHSIGSKHHKTKLLELQLPDSRIYDFLKGRMEPVFSVLEKLVIQERKDLQQQLATLEKNAKFNISLTKSKVDAERVRILESSKLVKHLELMRSSSDDDAQRRTAEAELLDLYLQMLSSVPKSSKQKLKATIADLVDGMVLFTPYTPVAFLIYWDWQDPCSYTTLDPSVIESFCELYDHHGLSNLLQAFLHSDLNPSAPHEVYSQRDLTNAINEGYNDWKGSLFAARIASDLLLETKDYASCVQVAEHGLQLAQYMRTALHVDTPNTTLHLKLNIGRAYVDLSPPQNFTAATQILDEVLQTDPANILAKRAQAMLLLAKHQVKDAQNLFAEVHQQDPQNDVVLEELAWCDVLLKNYDTALERFQKILEKPSLQNRALIHYRIGIIHWDQNHPDQAYNSFINALKENPSFAGAYTYLGLYYQAINDSARATKCFYRALELDNTEIRAARELALDFANQSRWDLVEVVVERVLQSEALVSGSMSAENAWVFRTMGIVSLNKSDHEGAARFFQRSLRLDPLDCDSWVGLGEAYIHSGRYSSALKALTKALEVNPNSFSALYEMSVAQRENLEFEAASKSIEKAVELAPDNKALASELVANYAQAADFLLKESYLGGAVDYVHKAFKTCTKCLENPDQFSIWFNVSLCCEILLQAKAHKERLNTPLISEICSAIQVSCSQDVYITLRDLLVGACEKALECARGNKRLRAVGNYNLAVAHFKSYVKFGAQKDHHQSQAIDHLKAAITLEPKNETFWCMYGCVIEASNPRVAQHCFIRSLNLNHRAPGTWASLGLLYLGQGDIELASQTFDRAMAIDSDASEAWLGKALIEYLTGQDTGKVTRLFEYAYLISPGSDRISKLLFGLSALAQARETGSVDPNGILALEKLLALDPDVEQALMVMGLCLERVGEYDDALQRLQRALDSMTGDKAWTYSHMSRLYLGLEKWDEALEYATLALDSESPETKVNLCALLVSGLAHFFNKNFDAALDMFTAALEYSEENSDVVVLLVQVLWAHGGDDEKEAALEQIYETLQSKGPDLQLALVLGVIGLLNNDEATRSAVQGYLGELGPADWAKDKLFRVQDILSRLEKSSSPYYRAIFALPGNYRLWKHVNSEQALLVAEATQSSPREISEALYSVGGGENLRRALFYDPGNKYAWHKFAEFAVELKKRAEPEFEEPDIVDGVSAVANELESLAVEG